VKYFAISLALSLSCGAAAGSAGASPKRSDLETIVRYLQPAVGPDSASVRLYYAAKCAAGTDVPPVPPIHLQEASGASKVLAAVRMLFLGDGNVVVTERPQGIIGITIGDVPQNLLRTRIRFFRLTPEQQYNPILVIDALEDTTEMKDATASLGLRLVPLLHVQLITESREGPHLPAVLRDVTVDHVLDLVAEILTGGVVAYGACTSGPAPRPLYINWMSAAT
jgi:hypothetical protein